MNTTTQTIAAACLLLCMGMAMAQDKAKQSKATQERAAQEKAKQNKAKQDKAKKSDAEAKEVSGMSIVGNSEAPKSLTIIPWKSSEIGRDADFKSSLLGQEIAPIDKPSFLRGLDFYKLSNRN